MEDNWHKIFMRMAIIFSEGSKCLRKKVAAIIVKDGRILSTGLNGTVPGAENCCEYFKDSDVYSKKFYKEHGEWSENNAIHAEQGAISFAAKNGVSTQNCDIYLTLSPCLSCSKLLITAGIKRVFYLEEYDRDNRGLEFLKKNKIEIKQINLKEGELNE